jgi:predicted Rdx family selenoprotein
VAATIQATINENVDIEPGARGEFSVWVDGVKVAEKSRTGFPAEKAVVEAVTSALR